MKLIFYFWWNFFFYNRFSIRRVFLRRGRQQNGWKFSGKVYPVTFYGCGKNVLDVQIFIVAKVCFLVLIFVCFLVLIFLKLVTCCGIVCCLLDTDYSLLNSSIFLWFCNWILNSRILESKSECVPLAIILDTVLGYHI